MYSEKATTVCETSIVDLSFVVPVKSMLEIFQNHVAFSEFMNFKQKKMTKGLTGFFNKLFVQQDPAARLAPKSNCLNEKYLTLFESGFLRYCGREGGGVRPFS